LRNPKQWALMLIGLVIVLLGLLGWSLWKSISLYIKYYSLQSLSDFLILLPTIGQALWIMALSFGMVKITSRVLKNVHQRHSDVQPTIRLLYFHSAIIALLVLTAAFISRVIEKRITERDLSFVEHANGFISGIVVDSSGKPIKGIGVELIPCDKKNITPWNEIEWDWTNGRGFYQFKNIDPGNYMLAVNKNDAPDGDHPFAKAFYPGTADIAKAAKIMVISMSDIHLKPLSLRELPTVKIKVRVAWADGTVPTSSNLSFHNQNYPYQAVIGDVAPEVKNGEGEFILPLGFEYQAVAAVECDAGETIQKRESPPIQFDAKSESFPNEIVFTIPGPACRLWSPQ
jgi:hypothetical protein